MRIFRWENFNDIIEDRIENIDSNTFENMLENCHTDKILYKNIYQPDFEIGVYNRSFKSNELIYENNINDLSYPIKDFSLVCSTINEKCENTTTFVVLPFKESLFTIKKDSKFLKGYWKDKIKWLDTCGKAKLWTENKCLLIKKDLWDKINERSTNIDREILATTLIGEAGGDKIDTPMVLNVIRNRAKNRSSSLRDECLRKKQFSMWNRHYSKNESLESIITEYKNNSNWSESHWNYVYDLIDNIDKLKDNTKGAKMYYAHKKTLPYWANNNHSKMKELGKEWKTHTKNHQHTYGDIISA